MGMMIKSDISAWTSIFTSGHLLSVTLTWCDWKTLNIYKINQLSNFRSKL